MKLNHKFALLLAGAVLAGALVGCGASGAPASSAASSEAAASSAVSEAASEPAAEAALPDASTPPTLTPTAPCSMPTRPTTARGPDCEGRSDDLPRQPRLQEDRQPLRRMAADAEAHEPTGSSPPPTPSPTPTACPMSLRLRHPGGGSGHGLPAGHPRHQGQVVRPYRPCRQRPACCGGSTCRRHYTCDVTLEAAPAVPPWTALRS